MPKLISTDHLEWRIIAWLIYSFTGLICFGTLSLCGVSDLYAGLTSTALTGFIGAFNWREPRYDNNSKAQG